MLETIKESLKEMPFVGPGWLGGPFPIDFLKEIVKDAAALGPGSLGGRFLLISLRKL